MIFIILMLRIWSVLTMAKRVTGAPIYCCRSKLNLIIIYILYLYSISPSAYSYLRFYLRLPHHLYLLSPRNQKAKRTRRFGAHRLLTWGKNDKNNMNAIKRDKMVEMIEGGGEPPSPSPSSPYITLLLPSNSI
jgi:hypothetical protein